MHPTGFAIADIVSARTSLCEQAMLLLHLYELSLETPFCWAMYIGLPSFESDHERIEVEYLSSYIWGMRQAAHLIRDDADDIAPFLLWMRNERGGVPSEGWFASFLKDSDGDHLVAIRRFFELLHQYLELTVPDWFIEYNAEPRPGLIVTASGKPRREDIRKPEHIALTADATS